MDRMMIETGDVKLCVFVHTNGINKHAWVLGVDEFSFMHSPNPAELGFLTTFCCQNSVTKVVPKTYSEPAAPLLNSYPDLVRKAFYYPMERELDSNWERATGDFYRIIGILMFSTSEVLDGVRTGVLC